MKIKDLNEDMINRIVQSLIRTWDYVAYDCFVDGLGNTDYSITFDRDEVFELAADANFDYYHGDQEAHDIFRSLENKYEEKVKFFAPKAFPFKKYGY